MFLQTIVQLHILLAATPALAGWTLLMPAAQSLPTHVYCVVSHSAVRGSSDVSSVHVRVIAVRRVQPSPALRLSSCQQSQECADQDYALLPAASLTQTGIHFPRAARAP